MTIPVTFTFRNVEYTVNYQMSTAEEGRIIIILWWGTGIGAACGSRIKNGSLTRHRSIQRWNTWRNILEVWWWLTSNEKPLVENEGRVCVKDKNNTYYTHQNLYNAHIGSP
jgi:hypothetical protein